MSDELLQKSVTAADQQDYRQGGPWIFNLFSGDFPGIVALPPDVPAAWGFDADRVLRSTIYHEPLWAGGVRRAISKQAALGFYCEDSGASELRIKRAKQLYIGANGRAGWVPFVKQHLRDYLLTDNGSFVEIVRATSAYGSRVLGLMHLSSARSKRTGDPDYPVLYTDRNGVEHALRWYQVLSFSDMPRSDDAYNGVGFCAAHGAYPSIYTMAGMSRYFAEKITGSRALSVQLIQGLSEKTLQSAKASSEAGMAEKGYTVFKGSIVVPIPGEIPIKKEVIELASVPDGFDPEQVRRDAITVYALHLGIPVQDIEPLSGQGLGTGTQTMVQAEDAEGYGLADWRRAWQHAQDDLILPETTSFHFTNTNDLRDQRAKAEVAKLRADTRKVQIEAGEIVPAEARQMAADAQDIPQSFIEQDQTPQSQLDDTEKLAPGAASEAQQPQTLMDRIRARIAQQQPAQPAVVAKEAPQIEAVGIASEAIAQATEALQAGEISVSSWEAAVETALKEAHEQAYRQGLPSGRRADARTLQRALKEQSSFLGRFADEIRLAQAQGDAWQPGWSSRAQLYAQAVKASYWRGRTAGYTLPAVPGDGTSQCIVNCKCTLDIEELDGDGNANITWVYGDAKHCQTCIERAQQWAPLRFRKGELQ